LGRQRAAVEPALNEALANLDAASRQRLEWPGLCEKVLDAAAREIVDEWQQHDGQQVDAAAKVISCGSRQAADLAAEVAKPLSVLWENLRSVLQAAAVAVGTGPEDPTEIPVPSGMPILDLAAVIAPTPLRGSWLALVSRGLACRKARAKLTSGFGRQLASLLGLYVSQLNQWRLDVLAQLRRSFTATADLYRAQCPQRLDSADLAAIEGDLKRLQALSDDCRPADTVGRDP
jgi:hypothetical protein